MGTQGVPLDTKGVPLGTERVPLDADTNAAGGTADATRRGGRRVAGSAGDAGGDGSASGGWVRTYRRCMGRCEHGKLEGLLDKHPDAGGSAIALRRFGRTRGSLRMATDGKLHA